MTGIELNMAEVRQANTRMAATRNMLDSIANELVRLQTTIDSRVLDQSNLRSRLNNAQRETASIGTDLQNLREVIIRSINMYEETDAELAAKAPSFMNSTGPPRNLSAFVL